MRAIGMTGKVLPKNEVEGLKAQVAELTAANEEKTARIEELEAQVAELTAANKKSSKKEDKKEENETPKDGE